MSDEGLERRRSKVNELLRLSIDKKLLRGGSSDALALLEKAYDLATTGLKLPAPWTHLIAYRLAHLKSRATGPDRDELERIDALFAEASELPELRAFALAYRVAILTRLEVHHPSSLAAHWQKKRLDCFQKAVQAIRNSQLNPESRLPVPAVLQSTVLNLLEFASYMLALPYKDLEGLAISDVIEQCYAGGWYIAGRGIEKIRMTEGFARSEFKARTAASDGLFIELSRTSATWWLVSKGVASESQTVNQDHAKLVLLSIVQPPLLPADLQRRVVGTDGKDSAARFRQVKSRTQKGIQSLARDENLLVFHGNILNPDICVIGLVEEKS
ncbi:MAG: hypothetical protein ACK6D6_18000 [Planctomyces sp.]|jgi:hypothetical protein